MYIYFLEHRSHGTIMKKDYQRASKATRATSANKVIHHRGFFKAIGFKTVSPLLCLTFAEQWE